jgi:hypothetical protein
MRHLFAAVTLVSLLGAPVSAERPAAAVAPPIAYWVPFEVTTPAGSKAKLVLVPSQIEGKFVLMTADFVPWHLSLADGATPTPSPTPGPSPAPTPVPVAQTLWITVIEESAQRTPAQAAVITSKAVADLVKAKSHHWRVADQNAKDESGAVPADLAGYIQHAAGKLPYIALTDQAGKIIYEGALPATEAELVSLLKKYGGN